MKILQPKQSFKSPIWAEKPKSGNTDYCAICFDHHFGKFAAQKTKPLC